MFDRIAPRYDLLNRAMTAGLDGRWRQAAAAAADLAAGDRALDCCTGTGDLALALSDRVTPSGRGGRRSTSPSGCSPWPARRPPRRGRAIDVQVADALALPFPDGTFDAATVAFGIRNVADLDRGLAEMARVVRPGGRVVILEITTPGAAAALLRVLVRPGRAAPRPAARSRRRRLLVPAGVGAALPRAAGAGRPDGGGGPGRRALARRSRAASSPSTTGGSRDDDHRPSRPSPCRWRRSSRGARSVCARRCPWARAGGGASPALDTLAAGGKRVRPLLVFCAAPRAALADPAATRGPAVGGGGGRAGAHGDAGARRPARRRDHAPGPAHRGRSRSGPSGRSRTGDFLFACAFGELTRTALGPRGAGAGRRRPRPVAGRDRPAAGRVRPGAPRGGVPRALPAQDRRPLLGGLPPRGARWAAAAARPRSGWRPSARTWGWPSRSSTTSSTWRARRRRPASAAAPTSATARSPCR